MDICKVNVLVRKLEKRKLRGLYINIEDLKTMEEVRTSPFLDRVDGSVLVKYPSMIDAVWEGYEALSGFEVSAVGSLSFYIGGNDCDGDLGATQVFVWPSGVWLKFETELTPVPNPYYEAPDEEAGTDADEE